MDTLGKVAEEFGPLSVNVEKKLREFDKDIQNILQRLKEVGMDDFVRKKSIRKRKLR